MSFGSFSEMNKIGAFTSFLQVVQTIKGFDVQWQPVPLAGLHCRQHGKKKVFGCDVTRSQCKARI